MNDLAPDVIGDFFVQDLIPILASGRQDLVFGEINAVLQPLVDLSADAWKQKKRDIFTRLNMIMPALAVRGGIANTHRAPSLRLLFAFLKYVLVLIRNSNHGMKKPPGNHAQT